MREKFQEFFERFADWEWRTAEEYRQRGLARLLSQAIVKAMGG